MAVNNPYTNGLWLSGTVSVGTVSNSIHHGVSGVLMSTYTNVYTTGLGPNYKSPQQEIEELKKENKALKEEVESYRKIMLS